jgi:predicted DNA-binding protein (UPF0251 family)
MAAGQKAARPRTVTRKGGATRGPSGYVTITDTGLEQIRRDSAAGLNNQTIAHRLGIDRWTLQQVRQRQPEVEEALQAGRALLEDELTDILLTHARQGNVVAAIFLAKARCGWREGVALDGAQQVTNIQINALGMTTGEMRERVSELLAIRGRLLGEGDG